MPCYISIVSDNMHEIDFFLKRKDVVMKLTIFTSQISYVNCYLLFPLLAKERKVRTKYWVKFVPNDEIGT